MTSYVEIAEAVVARVRPALPKWSVLWFKPAPPPVPSLCVCPDPNKYADYQVTNSGYAHWALRLELYATANDREAAHRVLGALTDPRGKLITTLLSQDIHDTLWELVGQDIAVTDGKGWKLRGGRSPYLTASIGLQCGAN